MEKRFKPTVKINYQIKAPQIRLIDEAGENLGIIKTEEAFKLAKEKGLDLVEISSKTEPPVCRLLNFGKYSYKLERETQKQKSKQKKQGGLKEVRITFRSSLHDLEIKVKKLEEFIEKGFKVKVSMILKGREKQHKEFARKKFMDFLGIIKEEIKPETEVKKTPNGFEVIMLK